MVGVGKNSVGTRLRERERPSLDLADERQNPDRGDEGSVGLEEKGPCFFSHWSGQKPKEPKGGGGKHQNRFQTDPQLIFISENGGEDFFAAADSAQRDG